MNTVVVCERLEPETSIFQMDDISRYLTRKSITK